MPQLPKFDPADFKVGQPIDNPYSPFIPGTTYHFTGRTRDDGASAFEPNPNNVHVTAQTKMVDGVQAVIVHDTDIVAGQKTEFTSDYYAQDKVGNVWYMGEFSTQYVYDKHGHVTKTTHEGSFEAGVDGAKPGIVMLAHPRVGDSYFQEHEPGVALDAAKVVAVDQKLVDGGRTYRHVLVTRETSRLEPTIVEMKYYAPGLGFVRSDEYDHGVLVAQSHLKGVEHGGAGVAAASGRRTLTMAWPTAAEVPATLTDTVAHTAIPAAFPVAVPDLAHLF
jgi:hypothetical protein